MFPLISTPRLRLRSFELSDARSFYELMSNRDVLKYLGRDAVTSVEMMEERISGILESYKNGEAFYWAICTHDDPKMVGNIGFQNWQKPNNRTEVGYSIMPAFWGKGLMTEALSALCLYLFEYMKFHSLEANIDPANTGSVKLLEKVGFVKEAHFRENYVYGGKFWDSGIYSLIDREFVWKEEFGNKPSLPANK